MIHLLSRPAAAQQIKEMLEVHSSYVKLAVDIRRGVLAGGGEFHADCEAVLIEDGSRKEDIWGADWIPEQKQVRCSALINIRPRLNPAMEIQDHTTQARVEEITRTLLGQA